VGAVIQRRFTNSIGVAADLILWLLTVCAGIFVWAPITGLEAANQTIAMRRERRRRIGALRESAGEVWARHAGRQPLADAYRMLPPFPRPGP
jgi:hypothetical protein